MANEEEKKKDPKKNIGMAVLCYLGVFIIIPLITDARKDPFVKFHIKQGLVLLVAWLAVLAIGLIPVAGWFLVAALGPLLVIVLFVFFLIGIINAAGGKEEYLPLIGKLADKIKV